MISTTHKENFFVLKERNIATPTAASTSNNLTLLCLDGVLNESKNILDWENLDFSAPNEVPQWLDLRLFGSAAKSVPLFRSFGITLTAQKMLENKTMPPCHFRDGNNEILICRTLHISDRGIVFGNNICFIVNDNKLISLQHGHHDKIINTRPLVATLKAPYNTIPHALMIIINKIIDENWAVIRFIEERLHLLIDSYAEQDEKPESQELLKLRQGLTLARQALLPLRRIINHALSQEKPLLMTLPEQINLFCLSLQASLTALDSSERLLDSLEVLVPDSNKERADNLLKTLTTSTALFLPLIFISNIFAMNFENMPELKSQYGYPICLGVLAIIALVTLKRLYRK